MKFVDEFEAFLRVEVNLNQTRIERLERSVGAIQDVLSKDITFGKIFLDVIPAGSWAHGTIIRPVRENDEFDADMLLYVKKRDDWQPKDYLEKLWIAFRSNDRYKDKAQRKTRCVRIDYQGEFHIDVVPYVKLLSSHCITNRYEPRRTGRFELSDPLTFTAWIDERQRLTNENFIKAVRLMKYLRDFKNTFDCKSIILMTLLGTQVNAVEARYHPDYYRDVPSTLVTLLDKLAQALPMTMPAVLDPANTGENFTDRYGESWNYSNFRACMLNYAQRVRSAYEEENRNISIKQWRSVFGDTFKPSILSSKAWIDKLFSESFRCVDEQFIDQSPYNFPIRINPRFRIRIIGHVTGLATDEKTPRKSFRQFELSKQGNLVPKNRKLEFTLRTNIAESYDVYWKVRNSGAEARDLRQLRGEICEDEGFHQKTETASYAGRHYIECYIVIHGMVVAWDRQNVIVIKYP